MAGSWKWHRARKRQAGTRTPKKCSWVRVTQKAAYGSGSSCISVTLKEFFLANMACVPRMYALTGNSRKLRGTWGEREARHSSRRNKCYWLAVETVISKMGRSYYVSWQTCAASNRMSDKSLSNYSVIMLINARCVIGPDLVTLRVIPPSAVFCTSLRCL